MRSSFFLSGTLLALGVVMTIVTKRRRRFRLFLPVVLLVAAIALVILTPENSDKFDRVFESEIGSLDD